MICYISKKLKNCYYLGWYMYMQHNILYLACALRLAGQDQDSLQQQ